MTNGQNAAGSPISGQGAGPWTVDALAVARSVGTDLTSGLSQAEASARLQAVGPNELLERRRASPWRLLAGQFANTMIVVLVIAAAVTAIIGDLKDSIVILAIVALNGVIGFVQEYRADRAIALLKEMTSPTARTLRGGEVAVIAAAQLVPGDVVRLEAGDVVPADLRLIEPVSIRVNESGQPVDPTAPPARLPCGGRSGIGRAGLRPVAPSPAAPRGRVHEVSVAL